jgi:hypothetical protein
VGHRNRDWRFNLLREQEDQNRKRFAFETPTLQEAQDGPDAAKSSVIPSLVLKSSLRAREINEESDQARRIKGWIHGGDDRDAESNVGEYG